MQIRMSFFVGLLVYATLVRVLPYFLYNVLEMPIDPEKTFYPWNFSPLAAIALFAGATLRDWRTALLVPLSVLFLSDLGVWGLTGQFDFGFHRLTPFTYGCFALFALMGLALRPGSPKHHVLGVGLVGEAVFFVVTNFGMWAVGQGAIYPLTAEGLLACYVAALPFLGRSLLSTGLFSLVLFSPLAIRAAGGGGTERVARPVSDGYAATQ